MLKKFILAAALAAATPITAFAASVGLPHDYYHVKNMEWDNESPIARSFWLPNLVDGSNKLWKSTEGKLTIVGNDATLTGTAANTHDMELTFKYSLSFTRRDDKLNGYCQFDGAKRDCDSAEYKDLVDPSTWDYFDFNGAGSFTGTGLLKDVVWSITDRASGVHPPQGGHGANALTEDTLGFSTWITSTLISGGEQTITTSKASYTLDANGTTFNGDINLDLVAAPLPGAAWLLIAGVAGLGAVSRRKNRNAA